MGWLVLNSGAAVQSFVFVVGVAISVKRPSIVIYAILGAVALFVISFFLSIYIDAALYPGNGWAALAGAFGPIFAHLFLGSATFVNLALSLNYLDSRPAYIRALIGLSIVIAFVAFGNEWTASWGHRKLHECTSVGRGAISACEELLASDETDQATKARVFKGRSRARRREPTPDIEGAIDDLEEAVSLFLDIDSNEARSALVDLAGLERDWRHSYKTAIEHYNKALELSPSNSYIYFQRSWAQMLSGHYDLALSDVTVTIEDPKSRVVSEAKMRRAIYQAKLGDETSTLASLSDEQVVEFVRGWPIAGPFFRIQALRLIGKPKAAFAEFKLLVKNVARRDGRESRDILDAIRDTATDQKLVGEAGDLERSAEAELSKCFFDETCYSKMMDAIARAGSYLLFAGT